ncbi:negative transcriptional regulator, PaiB family [Pseudoxanthomonas sp. GM95]|uniref:FMN-binding negative transcriptional regulator n=1 Tax=Pseudoxanthomonas sp. GM95 TaxID=1881043 RepID=UPI0008C46A1A|nr:FMN-binding negative transcriptional regulator [Pseudoxanthomonas sp. GM95]SEL18562.1 negative transcriptional regulator, PaiB family [Pseudoxanthomonas sp. GM95]
MGHARDPLFAPRTAQDIIDLVAHAPLAWLVSAGGEDAAFTPLPLRAELDAEGDLVALRGHLARRNPHVSRLAREPQAQALFLGQHGYISPSWLSDRTQAPSWNYAAARFDLRVTLCEGEADIQDELRALSEQMEAGRTNAWTLDEMGARAARLATGVVAFRAEIIEVKATFKLGQDEREGDLEEILAGLRGAGDMPLVQLMEQFNAR